MTAGTASTSQMVCKYTSVPNNARDVLWMELDHFWELNTPGTCVPQAAAASIHSQSSNGQEAAREGQPGEPGGYFCSPWCTGFFLVRCCFFLNPAEHIMLSGV